MIHATYLEGDDKRKLEIFREISARCDELQRAQPKNVNGHYFQAYALGRYSQGISVLKALTDGLGGRIKSALEASLRLDPRHAEAHVALGAYHAEVVNKMGTMVARLTYGASREVAVKHFETALKLLPNSAIVRIEYANALVLLFGDKRMDEAIDPLRKSCYGNPCRGMERLDVELAKSELEE
jgi:tetratricopeptide (TPR) repeat protein